MASNAEYQYECEPAPIQTTNILVEFYDTLISHNQLPLKKFARLPTVVPVLDTKVSEKILREAHPYTFSAGGRTDSAPLGLVFLTTSADYQDYIKYLRTRFIQEIPPHLVEEYHLDRLKMNMGEKNVGYSDTLKAIRTSVDATINKILY